MLHVVLQPHGIFENRFVNFPKYVWPIRLCKFVPKFNMATAKPEVDLAGLLSSTVTSPFYDHITDLPEQQIKIGYFNRK